MSRFRAAREVNRQPAAPNALGPSARTASNHPGYRLLRLARQIAAVGAVLLSLSLVTTRWLGPIGIARRANEALAAELAAIEPGALVRDFRARLARHSPEQTAAESRAIDLALGRAADRAEAVRRWPAEVAGLEATRRRLNARLEPLRLDYQAREAAQPLSFPSSAAARSLAERYAAEASACAREFERLLAALPAPLGSRVSLTFVPPPLSLLASAAPTAPVGADDSVRSGELVRPTAPSQPATLSGTVVALRFVIGRLWARGWTNRVVVLLAAIGLLAAGWYLGYRPYFSLLLGFRLAAVPPLLVALLLVHLTAISASAWVLLLVGRFTSTIAGSAIDSFLALGSATLGTIAWRAVVESLKLDPVERIIDATRHHSDGD